MEISKIKIYHKSRPNSSGVTSLNKAIQITLASLPPFTPLHHSFALHRSPTFTQVLLTLVSTPLWSQLPPASRTRLWEKVPLQNLATFFSSKFWNLQIRQELPDKSLLCYQSDFAQRCGSCAQFSLLLSTGGMKRSRVICPQGTALTPPSTSSLLNFHHPVGGFSPVRWIL